MVHPALAVSIIAAFVIMSLIGEVVPRYLRDQESIKRCWERINARMDGEG